MKINDFPGPKKPNLNPADETQKISKKPEKAFSIGRTGSPEGASLINKAQQARFPGVSAQFSKNDLRNPQKVDAVVQASVQELIQTEFPEARFSSEEARKNFIELVANDPLFRNKLLGHLEKLLA
jgi:hypothetical protein